MCWLAASFRFEALASCPTTLFFGETPTKLGFESPKDPTLLTMLGMDQKRPRSRLAAAARALVVGLAILISLIAILACIWRPDALAALTLVPPWCWLVAGLCSILLVWRTRQSRTLAALAGFWIVFTFGWVEELHSVARLIVGTLHLEDGQQGQPLRIVSLNCGGSEHCLADLQSVNADVVLLQEAPGREALARMTAELFGEVGEFCTGGDAAILARGSLSNQLEDQDGVFIAARVRFSDGRGIACTSLRLSPPPSRLDPWTLGFWQEHRQLRELHRRQLAEVIKALTATNDASAAVVAGDFNTMPLDAALDDLRSQFTDSFVDRGVGWGATGTNDWPLFRVDQIWTSARLAPVQTFARKTAHSDHRMVICEADVGP
jgi:vancomycin resistance protein VanJ